ncbi:MFS transporter [Tranquillimonas alkanivorans]|uniref:Predicted arabinose efflux permease, MFS family n=1 Tax=Tranquillimonas alkanivorans TaxID=441119 RepID=A0A1I5MFR8_9RHOB|nr:MFS transporter [Tranquillimonas alkanivorans]SFP08435.1 Predicted arabinose efflux permease, MFS family [Tranquillimonas alkanivorans]
MVRQILPISALLLGSAFLLFAGGVNGLILPVRGSFEGFTAFSLGLLGTGWAVGYVLGCFYTPRLVARVGHIRAFSVMAAFAAIAVLGSLLLLTPWAWIPLRGISGFCFAGAAMIVESWLSERAEPQTRGRIFGIYTMVNLGATTGGQMILTLGDTAGFVFFVIPAMFYCLALVPTAISSTTTPKPLVSVKLDLGALWRNSPVAVFAVFMVGISNASFGALAAVYGDRIGLSIALIALFTSVPILAGAVAQVPIGNLSDRMDRRKVLVGIAALAIVADLGFILLAPEGQLLNLVLAGIFGIAIFSMYPVIVAHANDHAEPDTYIQTSGGLLMVFGLGSIIGPVVAGYGMTALGIRALFLTTAAAHVLVIGYAIWRIMRSDQVKAEEKISFVATPVARASTPETAALALQDDVDAAMEAKEEEEAAAEQR